MQKKKKKGAQTTAVKQETKILHACDVGKGIIESVIEGKKTVLNLSDFILCIWNCLQSFTYMVYSTYWKVNV